MTQVFVDPSRAVADIPNGASLAVGGFGLAGIPDRLIAGIAAGTATDLEVVSNNCGTDGIGLGLLLEQNRIRRVIASYVGENREFARQFLSGELEVELSPQGTLAERLRAGGCGIPAFFTPAGVGTLVADGGLPWRYAPDGSVAVASPPKEIRDYGDKQYLLEESITTDYALVHAALGDTDGNLLFNKAAGNFNPLAAMAGRVCIAQVEKLVRPGVLDPGTVQLPGIFVDRIVCTGVQNKHIEKRTVAKVNEVSR